MNGLQQTMLPNASKSSDNNRTTHYGLWGATLKTPQPQKCWTSRPSQPTIFFSLEKFEVTTSASANFSLQIIQLYRPMIPTSWLSFDDLLLLLDLDIRRIEFSRRQRPSTARFYIRCIDNSEVKNSIFDLEGRNKLQLTHLSQNETYLPWNDSTAEVKALPECPSSYRTGRMCYISAN